MTPMPRSSYLNQETLPGRDKGSSDTLAHLAQLAHGAVQLLGGAVALLERLLHLGLQALELLLLLLLALVAARR